MHLLSKSIMAGSLILTTAMAWPQTPVKATKINGESVQAWPRQVIVRYKEGRQAQGRQAAQQLGGKTPLSQHPYERVVIPEEISIDDFIRQLSANPNIDYAEPNIPVQALAALTPNDPLFSEQWYLDQNHINIAPVWGDISQGSSTIIVAVIDSGISDNNPDISTGTLGFQFALDLNGDGDCLDAGEFCDSADPIDNGSDAHGTRAASLIFANINNGVLMAGIAPQCQFMPLRVLNENGDGDSLSVALAIDYAVENGASVINLSLGSDGLANAVAEAVQNALAHNVVIVAATGNFEGPIKYPAAIDDVIAVGSTDENDVISTFSRRGPAIDLVAPGEEILTLDQTSASLGSGTSFAAPLVSAVAALMKSINSNLTVAEITKYLNYYADDLGPSGFDTTYGFGRLNAVRSLQAVLSRNSFVSIPTEGDKTFPYPNPFNPSLGQPVKFNIPPSLGQSSIKITLFNLSGEPIQTLSFPDGVSEITWNGQTSSGDELASGLYYYAIETAQGSTTGKLTVLK